MNQLLHSKRQNKELNVAGSSQFHIDIPLMPKYEGFRSSQSYQLLSSFVWFISIELKKTSVLKG